MITSDELQQIVGLVNSYLTSKTTTIDNLPQAEGVNGEDYVEISGGKKVSVTQISNHIVTATSVATLTPVRCADEEELAAKGASAEYAEGQQFYIPEES